MTIVAGDYPVVAVSVTAGQVQVEVMGRSETLPAADEPTGVNTGLWWAAQRAGELGRPLRARVSSPAGAWMYAVDPSGRYEPIAAAPGLVPPPLSASGATPIHLTEAAEDEFDEDPDVEDLVHDYDEMDGDESGTGVPRCPGCGQDLDTTLWESVDYHCAADQALREPPVRFETPETQVSGWQVPAPVGLNIPPNIGGPGGYAEATKHIATTSPTRRWWQRSTTKVEGPDPLVSVQRVMYMVANRKGEAGKALSVDELVLTPQGYRPIGALLVGDAVYGRDGRPHVVTGVYPQGVRDLFRVRFTDGTTVLADGNHLWEVEEVNDRHRPTRCAVPDCTRPASAKGLCHPHYRRQRNDPGRALLPVRSGAYVRTVPRTARGGRVMTTDQLRSAGLRTYRLGHGWRHKFFVPVAEPIQFPATAVPVDPYLLGLLLGDGSLGDTLTFSTADQELAEAVAETVPAGVRVRYKDRYDYRLVRTANSGPNPLRDILADLGLLGLTSEHKAIPDVYRFGDIATRTAILQGLLDTDGWTDKGTACFCSTSQQLTEDVKFIAETLGCVTTVSSRRSNTYTHNGERRTGKPSWIVRIHAPAGLELFRLDRKKSPDRVGKRPPARAIATIEPAGTGAAVCISVNSADHLFLTRSCIPTHNTPVAVLLAAAFASKRPNDVVLVDLNPVGNLALRTVQTTSATVSDMVTALKGLDRLPYASDLDGLMNWQPEGFHAIPSRDSLVVQEEGDEPTLAPRLTRHDVDLLTRALQANSHVIGLDSGNNDSDEAWQRASELTNVLLVPVKWDPPTCNLAGQMLEDLVKLGRSELVRSAIIVPTWGPTEVIDKKRAKSFEAYFRSKGHRVMPIPPDPHLAGKGVITWARLKPATRDAALALAREVARG